jgi:hypothetical protein
VLQPFWDRKGGWEVARTRACEAASAVWPGEEDDRAGPACRRETVGRAG